MNRREFLKAGLAVSAVSIADWRIFAAEEGLPAYYGECLAKVAARVGKLAIAAVFCIIGAGGFPQEVQQDETPAVQHMAEQTVNRFPYLIPIP